MIKEQPVSNEQLFKLDDMLYEFVAEPETVINSRERIESSVSYIKFLQNTRPSGIHPEKSLEGAKQAISQKIEILKNVIKKAEAYEFSDPLHAVYIINKEAEKGNKEAIKIRNKFAKYFPELLDALSCKDDYSQLTVRINKVVDAMHGTIYNMKDKNDLNKKEYYKALFNIKWKSITPLAYDLMFKIFDEMLKSGFREKSHSDIVLHVFTRLRINKNYKFSKELYRRVNNQIQEYMENALKETIENQYENLPDSFKKDYLKIYGSKQNYLNKIYKQEYNKFF